MRKIIHKSKAFKTAANLPSKFTQRSEKRKKTPRGLYLRFFRLQLSCYMLKFERKQLKTDQTSMACLIKKKKIKSDSMV